MVGIIILNYNNWEDTEKCIRSIYQTTNIEKFKIYLIDNASSAKMPQTLIELVNRKKEIVLIRNKVNKGYSAGNNTGVKKALEDNCEAILIANNDIVFLDSSIDILYNFVKENPEYGIVGPKIYNLDGKAHIPAMLIKTGLKEKYLVNTFLRNIIKTSVNEYYCKSEDVNKSFEPHSVSGCCFIMSRECALQITPFDESTFLFEEELIIGIHMERTKFRTLYHPKSSIIHAHGQSTKNVKAFSYICKVESEIYYCKEYLKSNLILLFPFYIIRTLGYFLQTFQHNDFRKNIRNYFNKTLKILI